MINYKHLHYFWVVAKEGSITRASERLHLTPQTISGQLSLLEDNLGEALFNRVGRNLELTETGRLTKLNEQDKTSVRTSIIALVLVMNRWHQACRQLLMNERKRPGIDIVLMDVPLSYK